jgi:hypothetical protein
VGLACPIFCTCDQPKFSLLKSAPIPDLNSEEIYFRVASELSKPFASGAIPRNRSEFEIVTTSDWV